MNPFTTYLHSIRKPKKDMKWFSTTQKKRLQPSPSATVYVYIYCLCIYSDQALTNTNSDHMKDIVYIQKHMLNEYLRVFKKGRKCGVQVLQRI